MLVSMRLLQPDPRHPQGRARSRRRSTGLPAMRRMFDIVLHPKFAENKWIYFGYSKAGDRESDADGARARPLSTAPGLRDVQELYVSDPVTQGASRMAFAPDGTIYMTVSGAAGRLQRRTRSAQARHRLRQGDPPARRRHGAAGQSVRRQAGSAAGDLLARPSRSLRHRAASGDRPDVPRRARPVRRRQGQHPQGRRRLRLARLRLRAEQRQLADAESATRRGSSRRCSSGSRASRRRGCCSTRATGSRRGKAT